ncbi:MAG: hypothetical protein K2X99_01545 [Gemmatimonadaceae bacterium]|nr:hypothetical protein [Gemmatimonadaceae bacterium]
MTERRIAPEDRAAYLAEVASRRAVLAERACSFWVFESATDPNRVVEFCEAATVAALPSTESLFTEMV